MDGSSRAERLEADRALKESEAKFRSLAEQVFVLERQKADFLAIISRDLFNLPISSRMRKAA